MKAPKAWNMRVTLETSQGERIVRPITLTDAFRVNAMARARKLAPVAGQTVLNVEVTR